MSEDVLYKFMASVCKATGSVAKYKVGNDSCGVDRSPPAPPWRGW